MKGSVFRRFVTLVMIIVITSFIIQLTSMLTLATDYSQGVKEDSMRFLVQRTALSVDNPHFDGMSSLDKSKLLKNYAQTAQNSVIIILNKYGDIICHSGVPESGLGRISVPYLERIAADTDQGIINTTLGGLFNERYTVFPYCLYDDDDNFDGAILACAESGTDDEFVFRVLSMSLVSCAVALAVVFIMTYVLTMRFTEPLKQMSRAAKHFANGRFDIKLKVKGNDETAQLAQALNDMAISLQKSEQLRSEFLANVAHDLRTPMTTIAGFIDGIIDGVIPEEKHGYYLGIISEEVKRLSVLVNKLMELSKLDADHGKLNIAEFDIAELLKRIIIGFEQKIDKKSLSVEFDCDGDLCKVYADPDAIYQVCYNLMDNAVKFTENEGLIRVSVKDMGKKYSVTVMNTGEGISSEDLPHIFERFYKADKSRGLDKTGTGLGMFIAKTIINSHDEELTVSSVQGEYCSFSFTLSKGVQRIKE